MQENYPQSLHKKSLRHTVTKVCLTFAGFMLAQILIAFFVVLALSVFSTFLAMFSGIALNLLGSDVLRFINQIAGSSLASHILNMFRLETITQLLSVGLSFLVFFALRGKRLFTTDITTRRQTPSVGTIFALFGLILGVQFVMILINAIAAPLFEQVNLSLTDTMEESMSTFMLDPFGLFYVVLLGPLIEELVFRGAILRSFESYGANFAIVASAILFGLYHIILYQAFFAFLLGLLLAYTAGRFSLKWSFLLHAANNALAVSHLVFEPVIGSAAYSLFLSLLFFACFIFSIVLLVAKNKVLLAQKRAGAPLVAHPFAVLFTHPAFLSILISIVAMGVWMIIA